MAEPRYEAMSAWAKASELSPGRNDRDGGEIILHSPSPVFSPSWTQSWATFPIFLCAYRWSGDWAVATGIWVGVILYHFKCGPYSCSLSVLSAGRMQKYPAEDFSASQNVTATGLKESRPLNTKDRLLLPRPTNVLWHIWDTSYWINTWNLRIVY